MPESGCDVLGEGWGALRYPRQCHKRGWGLTHPERTLAHPLLAHPPLSLSGLLVSPAPEAALSRHGNLCEDPGVLADHKAESSCREPGSKGQQHPGLHEQQHR